LKAELEQLIALQNTDTNIRRMQAQLNATPHKRAEAEKEFEQRAFEFRTLESRRDAALEARKRLEREIAEQRALAERAERNLMASKNAKDYEAAIRELDATKKHISQLETSILEQMDIIETSEKELQQREPEIARLRAELDEQLKQFSGDEQTLAESIKRAQAEREQIFNSLPKQMSALYNRISTRIKDGIAVAEARNNSCSACHVSLRPQMMAAVRRGDEIILCENCSRILYYVPREQAQAIVK
jgi:predicted  nucleic acid-binding Zn-ribbon protein